MEAINHKPLVDNKVAAILLVGVKDHNEEIDAMCKHGVSPTVIGTNGHCLSCSLQELLRLNDTSIAPYNVGRELFTDALQNEHADLLSGTPLKYAYMWALACRSALRGKLYLKNDLRFNIKCEQLV